MIGLNLGLLARLAPKSREALEKSDVSIRVGEDLDDPEMKHPISTLSRVRSEAAEAAFSRGSRLDCGAGNFPRKRRANRRMQVSAWTT